MCRRLSWLPEETTDAMVMLRTIPLMKMDVIILKAERSWELDCYHPQRLAFQFCLPSPRQGPAASSKSYLNMDAVMDAVKATRADCVSGEYGQGFVAARL